MLIEALAGQELAKDALAQKLRFVQKSLSWSFSQLSEGKGRVTSKTSRLQIQSGHIKTNSRPRYSTVNMELPLYFTWTVGWGGNQ